MSWRCLMILAMALLVGAGCEGASESAEQVDAGRAGAEREEAVAEADWATQVAAVRAGEAEEIVLSQAEVTDADVADLEGLEGLKRLNLGRADGITVAGLEQIAAVPGIELLRLVGADIGDADLAVVGRMADLRYLMLYDVPITDEGVRHLHSLERLESFYFNETGITDAGVRELTAALPEVHVHW